MIARGRTGEEPTVYDQQRFDRISHAAQQDRRCTARQTDSMIFAKGLSKLLTRRLSAGNAKAFQSNVAENSKVVDLQKQKPRE